MLLSKKRILSALPKTWLLQISRDSKKVLDDVLYARQDPTNHD